MCPVVCGRRVLASRVRAWADYRATPSGGTRWRGRRACQPGSIASSPDALAVDAQGRGGRAATATPGRNFGDTMLLQTKSGRVLPFSNGNIAAAAQQSGVHVMCKMVKPSRAMALKLIGTRQTFAWPQTHGNDRGAQHRARRDGHAGIMESQKDLEGVGRGVQAKEGRGGRTMGVQAVRKFWLRHVSVTT